MVRICFACLFATFATIAWAGPTAVIENPGTDTNANLGFRAVSGIGDLTGDGRADFVAGAFRADIPGTGDAGQVFLYSGRTTDLFDTLSSPNPETGGWFGHAVLGFDDINADGIPELVVGASPESPGVRGAGRVYVFDGATRELLDTLVSPNPSAFGQFGVALGRVPDVNQDGVDELAVGAFRENFAGVGDSGRAYLFDSATGSLLHTFVHPDGETGTVFGIIVDGLDDLNGDGAGEILVGASGADVDAVIDAGEAFVFDGATGDLLHALSANPVQTSALLGFAAAGVPDLNGDEVMDIVLGAQADRVGDVAAGSVHVFDGATGDWLYRANPEPRDGGAFGIWVDGIEDVDGDGRGDFVVGGQNVDNGCVEDAGRAYLLSGADGALLRSFNSSNPQAAGSFGFALAAVEDANQDGAREVLIAAWGEASGAGRAHVFYSPLLAGTNGGLNVGVCLDECGAAPDTDADGDGLTECVEDCLGTNDLLVDSDFDGMPDGYEAMFGLDPLVDDSADDPDGDELSNLEEFLQNASPADARDPDNVVFVRPDGDNATGDGSLEMPWATIAFALTQVTGSTEVPARVVVLCGVHEGDLTLTPFVTIEGAPEGDVQILGTIQGAQGASLRNVLVMNPDPGELLSISDATMTVREVTFVATTGLTATGIRVENGGATVIDNCIFDGLAVGIEITGALPFVRRCMFDGCTEAGILVHGLPEKARAKSLGDQTDARTGWNTFRNSENFNVVNEGNESLTLEFNDWGTTDTNAIDAAISGDADFEPFLAVGQGILAASLFCTVLDAATQVRIDNATVSLAPGSYVPVTENVEGVYPFPALPGGSYTVAAQADGYDNRTVQVTLADAELLSLTITLGEEDNPEPPAGCACDEGTKGSPRAGDFLPAMAAMLGMVVTRRRWR